MTRVSSAHHVLCVEHLLRELGHSQRGGDLATALMVLERDVSTLVTKVGEELDGEDGVDAHDDDHDQERVGDAGHGLGERGHDLGEGGHALEQAEDTERTERPEQPEGGRQDLDVRSELDQRDRAQADDERIENVPAATEKVLVPYGAVPVNYELDQKDHVENGG